MEKAEVAILVANICFESGLYSKIEYQKGDLDKIRDYFIGNGVDIIYDTYCIHCKKGSTFKRFGSKYDDWLRAYNADIMGSGIFVVSFRCQRVSEHVYNYVFHWPISGFVKIGQTPSLEDIASADLEKFRTVLGKEYFSELHRAGGLYSHGIGIGSFVYLRRIFERLIFTHHEEYIKQNGNSVEGFHSMRIDEKIEALRSVLTQVLVKNKSIYSILSVGIHELDEVKCVKYFPVVRAGIVSMLEEDLQAQQKAIAAKDLEAAISATVGEIRNSKSTKDA